MNTSLRALSPAFRMARIIAARLRLALAMGAAVLLLGACSALQLGYNQAPSLMYWWVDGYADLNDAQSVRVRQDIDALLEWHRQRELPVYAERLRQWRTLVAGEVSPEQACGQLEALRLASGRLVERGHESMTRLALTLTPAQLQHMERHMAKSNESFEKDFVRGDPARRLERRIERAVDRYENLYGALTTAQVALVRQSLQSSSFDPVRSLTQRRERQAELLTLIRQQQASLPGPLSPDAPVPRAAAQRVLDWLQRGLFISPNADSPQAGWVRQGCQTFAELHNSTSAEQRRRAQQRLQGYEDDLQALVAAL